MNPGCPQRLNTIQYLSPMHWKLSLHLALGLGLRETSLQKHLSSPGCALHFKSPRPYFSLDCNEPFRSQRVITRSPCLTTLSLREEKLVHGDAPTSQHVERPCPTASLCPPLPTCLWCTHAAGNAYRESSICSCAFYNLLKTRPLIFSPPVQEFRATKMPAYTRTYSEKLNENNILKWMGI